MSLLLHNSRAKTVTPPGFLILFGAWRSRKEKPAPNKPEEPMKKAQAPKLKRAPVSGSYFHVSDLTMLPGRLLGQPLVNPAERKKVKQEPK